EHLVPRGVDALGLGYGAVVHPHHDVPAIVSVGADGHRAIGRVEEDERAGGVEADASEARVAAPHAAQMSSDDCPTKSSSGRWRARGCEPLPSIFPAASKSPARA